MVSAVTSTAQQQIPAANTFQPGGNSEDVRQKEDRETTRAAGTSTAETQSSETRNNGQQQRVTERENDGDRDDGQVKARASRGSVVDLTV